jgi:hypothetical protein
VSKHKSRGASPGYTLVYPGVFSRSTWLIKHVYMIDEVATCVLSIVQEECLSRVPGHIGMMLGRVLIRYMEGRAFLLVVEGYVSAV